MNILAELRQTMTGAGGEFITQICGEFLVSDGDLIAEAAFGVFIISRADILVSYVLADDYDRSQLESRPHVLVLN